MLGCDLVCLKALFSRSLASARDAAGLVPGSAPDLYAEDAGAGRAYRDLLLRDDVAAVIVALPIVAQPGFVEAALAAGKHVLAEKPIAKDVATARGLVDYYRGLQAAAAAAAAPGGGPTLSVAENFRFVPRLAYAAEQAARLGRVTHFSVKVMSLVRPSSKWYGTAWRRAPAHQGGFLLDGGVHHAAAARLFLRGAADRPASVRAFTDRACALLPPIDTVAAIVKTASGATGTFQHSAGTLMEAFEWDVACEGGAVRSAGETVTVRPRDGEPTVREFARVSAVAEEVAAWAEGILAGVPNPLQAPEEALADLEFLEKMFRSGEQDGALLEYEHQL